MVATPTRRLPVTVVTGFLGAGKTTLLRHLLLHSGKRLAVVVNEFGEVGIDGDLLRSCGFCPEEELGGRLVELANGCLCCTVQDEFLPTMQTLLLQADRLDGIVVETSGLALPEPLVQAFQWPEIRTRTRVNGVVAVVDGEALAQGSVVGDPAALEAQRRADPSLDHQDDLETLFDEQLEAADLVLVSRGDRLDPDQLAVVRRRLAAGLRPGARVLTMERGVVDPQLLLGVELREGGSDAHNLPHQDHDHDHGHDHVHVPMQSVALTLEGPFERSRLETILLDQIRQQTILRLKGRLWQAGKPRPLQIQAVGPRLECWYDAAPGPSANASRETLELVVLGLDLDAGQLEAAIFQSRGSSPLAQTPSQQRV
ncbi:cobalamin biosynthesis protein CobW [Cyanobium sp. ATX 6F1]|uniref:cobalamin biosynthesis protein CobW n=1 Tax=Cyanobium sp. ATX 6F1 TaxID=2823702 RepID=UPI0020CEE987|nr:cobalamin biosynthesis protein CobW [Cyanobium sp. ATX 6F1]MCP9916110.1 cobalamin biosynthesis protein CobW [Cyanobium sp. ATX 6F1]